MASLSSIIRSIEKLEAEGKYDEAKAERQRVIDFQDGKYANRLPPEPVIMPEEPPAEPEKGFWDEWGRPITEGAGALVGGAMGVPAGIPGIMAGAALGGHVGGMGYDFLGGEETPSPQEQVTSAAFNMFGGPTPIPSRAPAMLAGKVPEGNLFDIAGSTGGAPTVDDIVKERGGRLTAGTRDDSPVSARLEAGSESSPFSVDIWTKNRETNVNILDDLTNEAAPTATTRNVAGARAGLGYEETLDASYRNVDRLYKELDDVLKASGGSTLERISMDSLTKLMSNFDELVKRDGKFAQMVYQDPDLKGAIDAMREMVGNQQLAQQTAGGMGVPLAKGQQRPTYEVIKQLRTIIGNKIDDAFNQSGEAQGQKLLYSTLSDDLEAGVREIGGEAAVQARKAADKAKHDLEVQKKYLGKIFNDNNLDNPERLYEALSTNLLSDPNRVREAKRVLPKADWDRFVDTYIKRLTLANPGAQDITGSLVSPRTSVTNLAKLKKDSPEGYALLVEGREEAIGVVEELAQRLTNSEKYLNRSNTAGALAGQQFVNELTAGATGVGAGLFAGGPTLAAGLGLTAVVARPFMARAMAKALTNDVFARALTKVKRTYRDGLPEGMDLAKALIAAGADEADVQDLMLGDSNRPPLANDEAGALYQ